MAGEEKIRRKRVCAPRAQELRELRILERLGAGISVTEIAVKEKLTTRRVRQLIANGLSRRDRLPDAEFAELQVRRLNEALLVSYGAMTDGNLKAVDRVVTIVRELDRYHGRGPSPSAPALAPRVAAPPLALPASIKNPGMEISEVEIGGVASD